MKKIWWDIKVWLGIEPEPNNVIPFPMWRVKRGRDVPVKTNQTSRV